MSTAIGSIFWGIPKMSAFGDALRAARKASGMSQQALADAAGLSQAMITHLEVGRKEAADVDTVARMERVLQLPAGELVRHLPDNHPAKRMAVEIPVQGIVAAGIGCDAPADPGEVLRVSEQWAGCVAYRVRGDSMLGEHICDGDYLIVRPGSDATQGQIFVAWLASERGHVVKKLFDKGYLRSGGKNRWAHKLTDDDRIFGVLEAVVRMVGGGRPT